MSDPNVGYIDRLARAAAGIFLTLYILVSSINVARMWGAILLILGIIKLV